MNKKILLSLVLLSSIVSIGTTKAMEDEPIPSPKEGARQKFFKKQVYKEKNNPTTQQEARDKLAKIKRKAKESRKQLKSSK